MKKCKSCQSEIDDKATRCPHCHAKQPSLLKSIIAVIVIIVVVIIISSAISDTNKQLDTNAPHKVSDINATTTTTVTPTLMPTDFKVGDTIAINEINMKINSTDTNYTDVNDIYDTPETGHQYVLINVTLHNTSTDTIDYSSFDFKIQDSQGAQTTETITTSTTNDLNSGSLAANGVVTGNIVFDVLSANAGTLKIIYEPNFWDGHIATIDLN